MTSSASPAGIGKSGNWTPASTHIVRSICNPINQEEDLFESTFTVFANRVSKGDNHKDAVVLISEIQTSNVDNTHMVAATTMQLLIFFEKAPNLANETEYTEFLKQAAKWGGHMLWDFTTSYMRTIASGLHTPELRLPAYTTQPTLLASDGHTPLGKPTEENS